MFLLPELCFSTGQLCMSSLAAYLYFQSYVNESLLGFHHQLVSVSVHVDVNEQGSFKSQSDFFEIVIDRSALF